MSTPPTSLPSTPLPPLTPLQLPLDSLAPDPSYIDPLIALAPTPSNLSTLALSLLNPRPSSVIDLQSVTQVFTSAYLRAASSGDSDLIEWLLAKPESPYHLTSLPRHAPRHSHQPDPSSSSTVSLISSPNLLHPGQPRSYVNVDTTDEDGTPPIILAAAFGHPEAVRAIVDGIGGDVVDSRDAGKPLDPLRHPLDLHTYIHSHSPPTNHHVAFTLQSAGLRYIGRLAMGTSRLLLTY